MVQLADIFAYDQAQAYAYIDSVDGSYKVQKHRIAVYVAKDLLFAIRLLGSFLKKPMQLASKGMRRFVECVMGTGML